VTNEIRRRTVDIKDFRAETKDDGKHYVSGYAALFNVLSEELAPGMREKLAPGSFTDALLRSDPTANINHDDQYLLGRVSAGTLALREDALGLFFEVEVPDTSYARDLAVLMQRGDVTKNSFAFTVAPEDISVEAVNKTERIETINRVQELYDVAIVTSRPAYSQTFNAYRALTQDPQVTEAHERNVSEEEHTSESHTTEDVDIALEIAKLDLAIKAIEV
jgi:hypothetical protein